MTHSKIDTFLTYDDVLLRPGFSEVLPHETNCETFFSKNIRMNMPLISAAMDTVTEAPTAIVMAQQGGMGVIHKNLNPKEQAKEVTRVKKYESGVISSPITVWPESKLKDVLELKEKYKITGVPVVDEKNVLRGFQQVGICNLRKT